MIDLHCHSTYSDGALAPAALLELALKENIRLLALTDHDTVSGIMEFRALPRADELHIINGIELSVRWRKYDIHILGLNIDIEIPSLTTLIEQQQAARRARAIEISLRLESIGVLNAYDKACSIAGHERVGRPHFAHVLLAEGKVNDIGAAFKKYLIRGKLAYVETGWADLSTVISVIKQAGGKAVIAHPKKYKLTRTRLVELIEQFKAFGGEGLEVVSGDMNIADIRDLALLAQTFDLLASSGSDFHGFKNSKVLLGRQQQLPVNCNAIWQEWMC